MHFSKEELSLVKESVACNLAVHASLLFQEKNRLEDIRKRFYQIGQSYNKNTISRLTVVRDELISQRKKVEEYEKLVKELDNLIDKLNSDLTSE